MIASKRNLNDGSSEQLSKKIKLGHNLISKNITKNHPEIDISDHEIQMSLLIFNLFIESLSLEDQLEVDSEDGIQDIIITVATKFLKLLRGNIEPLKLSKVLKIVLKKLRDILLFPDGLNKDDFKDSLRLEMKTISATTATTRDCSASSSSSSSSTTSTSSM